MENCIILPCNCKNEYQDRVYGKGMRVHNKSFVKGKEVGIAYCTSCDQSRRRNKAVADVPANPAFGLLKPVPVIITSRGKPYGVKKEEKKVAVDKK